MEIDKVLKFDEAVTEAYILDEKNDFDGTEKSFLALVKEKDPELKGSLSVDVIRELEAIVGVMPFPLTIIYDPYYVDRVYRDEFYSYFSKKHFEISRNTKRLIFVKGKYERADFLNNDSKKQKEIEKNLIGMVVIKPTQSIGRILLSPFRLNIPECYVRTTEFWISVMGRIYSLEAFPASGQDIEVMTCAEVNMWQIMEYFGNRYRNYRVLLPSEMFEFVVDTSDVRLLPSEGLTVEQESHVFMKNGLSPKIYYRRSEYDDGNYLRSYEQYEMQPSFQEIFHFYVESGIPILMNLREKRGKDEDNEEDKKEKSGGENHSVTCIGHSANVILEKKDAGEIVLRPALFQMKDNDSEYNEYSAKKDLVGTKSEILEALDRERSKRYNKLYVYKSWLDSETYVMIEDHSVPYQLKKLNDLRFDETENAVLYEVESYVVPLYKHVFVTAEDAYEIFMELIAQTEDSIIEGLYRSGMAAPYDIVIRIFLTTSKAYKNFRISRAKREEEKVFYSQALYPKCIWICEYTSFDLYNKRKVLGEYILDATSAKYRVHEAVISIRHGDAVTYRGPNDPIDFSFKRRNIPVSAEYDMYENNLKSTKTKYWKGD